MSIRLSLKLFIPVAIALVLPLSSSAAIYIENSSSVISDVSVSASSGGQSSKSNTKEGTSYASVQTTVVTNNEGTNVHIEKEINGVKTKEEYSKLPHEPVKVKVVASSSTSSLALDLKAEAFSFSSTMQKIFFAVRSWFFR